MVKKFITNKTIIIISIFFIIGAILRFILISKIPVSIYWDEAADGYNAYSILHTGRDEYGTFFPILFRSFNDYKMGGYVYLISIAEFLFGLNEFAVRFPSAFFGSLTIILVFFLTKEILYFSKSFREKSNNISILAAVLFAICPWSINFSRAGFEANVALFFVGLAVWFFLKNVREHKKIFYFLSTFTFVVGIYFYRSEFVFIPLILIVLLITFKNFFKENLKLSIINLLFLIVLLIPLAFAIKSEVTSDRGVKVSVVYNAFDDQVQFSRDRLYFNNIIGKAIFNNKTAIIYKAIQNYEQNFNPVFLFTQGDPNKRHSTDGMGIIYLIDAPFLLFGLYKILRSKGNSKLLIVGWLLCGFIPSAIADINPHSLRGLNDVIIFEIIIAIGIFSFIDLLKNKNIRKITIGFTILLYLIFFIRFINLYFFVDPTKVGNLWADGYQELYSYIAPQQNNYKKIIISGHYWEPYVYFLFYSKYDPYLYQKNGSVFGFGKYIFGGTSWDLTNPNHRELDHRTLSDLAKTKDFIVAISPGEFQYEKKQLIPIKNIYNLNGKLVFIVAKSKN